MRVFLTAAPDFSLKPLLIQDMQRTGATISTHDDQDFARLAMAIRAVDLVLVALTPDAARSSLLRSTVKIAQAQGKLIVPVLFGGDTIPARFLTMTVLDYRDYHSEKVYQLRNALSNAQDGYKPPRPANPNAPTYQRVVLPPAQIQQPTLPPMPVPARMPVPPISRDIWLLLVIVLITGTILAFVVF